MKFVIHDRNNAIKVIDSDKDQELVVQGRSVQDVLYELASKNSMEFIGWCHKDLEDFINHDQLNSIFHHELIMASYSTTGDYEIPEAIGYIENSTTFLNVKPDVNYPTWLMSSDIGGMHAMVILKFENLKGSTKTSFDGFLNHISKTALSEGLFCYSSPGLLKKDSVSIESRQNKINLFYFVRHHYRSRWLPLLFLDYLLYEKKFKIGSLLKGALTPKLNIDQVDFNSVKIKSINSSVEPYKSYDVLIPTLGRAKYLKDVLVDLSSQTFLPAKVIIIEQNGLEGSSSELDYIYDQKWPFEIEHSFIHQLGACNARNLALKKVSSKWVFFADDDIRFKKDLVEKAFDFITDYGAKAISMASLMQNESLQYKIPIQWHTFSTNSSFVKSSVLTDIYFGMEHEFGFGEDSDFGMKIRNKGVDIIFYPTEDILHLKAPTGGFRVKMKFPWNEERIQPKPSPMVMAHRLKHTTKQQLLGYRTTLMLKFFNKSESNNPISYLSNFSKRWDKSILWATKLIEKYNRNGV
ncbi:MAG: glycosyltransferase family 2 protein [Flavobacteriaceae bacterium]|nr:glycosyltransferase family 2 protein [Flavobacteriaceae bacterium]NNK28690.1 glycosyltransferase family 2 protein [Flavobacteriaceae bacterium]